MAIASDTEITVWSLSRQEQVISIPYSANSVAMSRDGKQIVSGSSDNTVRRWSASSGEAIGDPLRGHEDLVTCVAVSVDGKQIVSGSYDNTVRRWNASSGEAIGDPLRGHRHFEQVLCGSSVDARENWNWEQLGYDKIVLPLEVNCSALYLGKDTFVFGLKNGTIAVCNMIK